MKTDFLLLVKINHRSLYSPSSSSPENYELPWSSNFHLIWENCIIRNLQKISVKIYYCIIVIEKNTRNYNYVKLGCKLN